MARLLACIALIVACALVCVYADEGLYSDRFDNIDVQAVFANEKLRRQYSGCLLGTGPCNTAPQRFLKEILGDAIKTQCKRCTEKQKDIFEYIIEWYTKNNPVQWEQIVRKLLADLQQKSTA